jgi:hypothetical protein
MNLPNINIKDILAKVSTLKNNLSLLVPILIAVVGLLLLIPTRILSARLRATVVKNSVAVGKDIDTIISSLSPDSLRIVSPKELDAMNQDANEIERLMDRASRRELLSYSLFPDVSDQSQELFAEFGRRYHQGITALVQSLNPGECPTWAQIQTALASAPQAGDATGMYGRPPVGGMGDRAYGGAALSLDTLTDTQRKMFDQLCLGNASAAKVYAAPSDLAGYTYWDRWTFEDRDKAYQDCWYWQLGYWVIEDVVTTVQQMNGSAESALTAPVKRLMNVSFTFRSALASYGRSPYGAAPGGRVAAGPSERPVYVTGPGKGMVTPCTGRVCNEAADVIQFNVQVVIDASQVMPFMQALCTAKEHRFRGAKGDEPEQKYLHNQITILETTVDAVEATEATHMRYRYGDRPVSKLDLICEYMFCRTPEYQRIKPPQAKKDLGEPVDAAAAAAPATGK